MGRSGAGCRPVSDQLARDLAKQAVRLHLLQGRTPQGWGCQLALPASQQNPVLGHTPLYPEAYFSDLVIHSFVHSFSEYIQQPLCGRLLGVGTELSAMKAPLPYGGWGDLLLTRKSPWLEQPHLLELRQSDTCTCQEEHWGQRRPPRGLSPTLPTLF